MSEWKECTISDLGTVVGGATPSTKDPLNYNNGNIPWITPKDLSNFNGRFISHGERNITEKGLNSCSAQVMPAHTVLFSSRAPIGYVAISECPMCTNQGFKSVVPNKDTDYLFLYYLLIYNRNKIENLGSGTTFKEVSGNTMKGVQVYVPVSLEKQQAIGSLLGTIDDKIEENQRINDNLESQAYAVYQDWFIDSGEAHGAIECALGDLIKILDYKRIPLSSQERAKRAKIYRYFGAAGLLDYVDEYLFDGIYLLVGEDGSVIDDNGYPYLQYVDGKFWVNNHAHILQGIGDATTELLYLILLKTNIKEYVTGAVQAKLNQDNLRAIPAIRINKDDMASFNAIIQPIFAVIRKNKLEIDNLQVLKASILTKLTQAT